MSTAQVEEAIHDGQVGEGGNQGSVLYCFPSISTISFFAPGNL